MKPETQAFLESLTDEDIARIKSSLKTYERVEVLAWWTKMVALTALALVVSLTQFADAFKAVKDWFK